MRTAIIGVLAILGLMAFVTGVTWGGIVLVTVAICIALMGLLTNKD